MYVANQDHVHWAEIVAGATADDESIVRLFDPGTTAAKRFERLTDRVSIANGKVYFDGDQLDNVLTTQILSFLEADEDFMPLVNFLEKLYQNPQQHAREQLYGWMRARDSITITPDGDLIAYKGLGIDENDKDLYLSWHAGTAMVNGEVFEDQKIPQRIGDTVEMPRSEVQFDPAVGCSTGLHAGTHNYASSYGPAKVRVAINPRDVVSVPTECDAQKIRVCRYVVIDVADAEVDTKPVYIVQDVTNSVEVDLDDDEGDFYCYNCAADDHDSWDCPEYEDDDDDY